MFIYYYTVFQAWSRQLGAKQDSCMHGGIGGNEILKFYLRQVNNMFQRETKQ